MFLFRLSFASYCSSLVSKVAMLCFFRNRHSRAETRIFSILASFSAFFSASVIFSSCFRLPRPRAILWPGKSWSINVFDAEAASASTSASASASAADIANGEKVAAPASVLVVEVVDSDDEIRPSMAACCCRWWCIWRIWCISSTSGTSGEEDWPRLLRYRWLCVLGVFRTGPGEEQGEEEADRGTPVLRSLAARIGRPCPCPCP